MARHVDVDGIRQDGDSAGNDLYLQTVDKARLLVRTLEAAVQALQDDSISILLATQTVADSEFGQTLQERDIVYDSLDVLCTSLKSNIDLTLHTLEALLSVGHDQADMAQGDYNGSIEWRMSRLSVIDNRFGGAIRPPSLTIEGYEAPTDDVVDMDFAFNKPTKSAIPREESTYESFRTVGSTSQATYNDPRPSTSYESTTDETMVSPDDGDFQDIPDSETSPLFDDDREWSDLCSFSVD